MQQWLIQYQLLCKLGCFVLAFSIFSLLETRYAWRPWITSRKLRIARHLSLSFLSKVILRIVFPLFAVTIAIHIEKKGMGIFHHDSWPYWFRFALGFIGLDLIMYLQHRILHKYQWLWRVHRVHHMDKEVDVSTGLRFHPLEEIYTMMVKMMGIAFLGALPLCVLVYEIAFIIMIQFAHINIIFSFKRDLFIRRLLITPSMHRIHHSTNMFETNSNYGFVFSWWDKLLGTYTFIPISSERKLAMGLEEYRDPKYQTLENMLLLPFNPKRLRLRPKRKTKLKFGV